jgi:hypothetical protein
VKDIDDAVDHLLVGIAADPVARASGKSRVGLPQIHPNLLCQFRQLTARALVKPGVRRIGNVLFHHGRVDGHALDTVVVDGTGFLPSLDRLGQQPLNTFLPIRPRLRVSDDGSIGSLCWKKVSPVKCW